ncbi:MAG TPA: hypothetical protein H9665_03800 [Firmicutes bacterium]|nr:hypothetical protein [Bacillota bacterium]
MTLPFHPPIMQKRFRSLRTAAERIRRRPFPGRRQKHDCRQNRWLAFRRYAAVADRLNALCAFCLLHQRHTAANAAKSNACLAFAFNHPYWAILNFYVLCILSNKDNAFIFIEYSPQKPFGDYLLGKWFFAKAAAGVPHASQEQKPLGALPKILRVRTTASFLQGCCYPLCNPLNAASAETIAESARRTAAFHTYI